MFVTALPAIHAEPLRSPPRLRQAPRSARSPPARSARDLGPAQTPQAPAPREHMRRESCGSVGRPEASGRSRASHLNSATTVIGPRACARIAPSCPRPDRPPPHAVSMETSKLVTQPERSLITSCVACVRIDRQPRLPLGICPSSAHGGSLARIGSGADDPRRHPLNYSVCLRPPLHEKVRFPDAIVRPVTVPALRPARTWRVKRRVTPRGRADRAQPARLANGQAVIAVRCERDVARQRRCAPDPTTRRMASRARRRRRSLRVFGRQELRHAADRVSPRHAKPQSRMGAFLARSDGGLMGRWRGIWPPRAIRLRNRFAAAIGRPR
jgi:hypothetical protein